MGFLSKAWGGLKKTVKTVAKTAKTIAKKVAYAVPGGKAVWKAAGKVGTKVLGAVGKVVNKLGPVGMIALSVLAPYAAPLWTAFGAAAGAAGGVLGSIGTAVYSAGNWVAGTLSSMSTGISKAIGTIADGGFSGLGTSLGKAGSEAVKGFADAFTGKAGSAAVTQGATDAIAHKALAEAAGQSVWKQAGDQIYKDVMGESVGSKAAEDVANKTVTEKAGESKSTSLLSKATTVAKSMLSPDGAFAPVESAQVQTPQVGQGQLYSGFGSSQGGLGSGGGSLLSEAMLQMQQETQRRMAQGFGG